ncbi:MAG TPA: restriction endonuclease subunit S [Candidatus Sulfotelmatobacter sp.]|nr:restriction endonuclease subunit S [Candidatus Sulfotelmatobacter sp.]
MLSKFSDYVELNPRVTLVKGERVPFVSMDAISPANRWVRAQEERPASGSGSKFAPGDTLFARITPCLENGKIAQFADDRPGMGSTEFFVLRARPNIADPNFVFYFARTRELRAAAEKSMSGASGRQRADITALSEFPCKLPSLLAQHRIAVILTRYDALIENCKQRIHIQEEMARLLYREWFVHFRFPGYENVPRVASRLGETPKGWEIKRVAECVQINPRITVLRNGEKPFVPMGCLSNDSMLITDIESRQSNSGAKFQNGDTLFARITPCLENGKTGFVQFLPDSDAIAFGSTEFIVLRSRTLTPEFVYLLARSDEFRGNAITSMSGASGRQRVQEKCFDTFFIVHPPGDLLDQFSAFVAPSFRLIHQLYLEIQNIRQTRDLLLPRLLSGQLQPE